ncbi:MAG TPA: PadR family transcriptional regulator [Candidatus Limnocylindria bacterium]|nr:PadR family transcriptional regulator [Candidatus Limnocylindria bacterium]
MTSDPEVLLLVSLAGGPKHGHAILLDIESFTGRRLGPGTLYGALSRLDAEGLIEPIEAEGRRRPYRLTASGRTELHRRITRLAETVRVGRRRLAPGGRLARG